MSEAPALSTCLDAIHVGTRAAWLALFGVPSTEDSPQWRPARLAGRHKLCLVTAISGQVTGQLQLGMSLVVAHRLAALLRAPSASGRGSEVMVEVATVAAQVTLACLTAMAHRGFHTTLTNPSFVAEDDTSARWQYPYVQEVVYRLPAGVITLAIGVELRADAPAAFTQHAAPPGRPVTWLPDASTREAGWLTSVVPQGFW